MKRWEVQQTNNKKLIVSELHDHEVKLLNSLVRSLLDLFSNRELDGEEYELSVITGIKSGREKEPQDPILKRLLPNFQQPHLSDYDSNYTSALRGMFEHEILSQKRNAALTLLESLPKRGGVISLQKTQAEAWLVCLTDLRLAIGTMVDVEAASMLSETLLSTGQASYYQIYKWLTMVQDLLVMTL